MSHSIAASRGVICVATVGACQADTTVHRVVVDTIRPFSREAALLDCNRQCPVTAASAIGARRRHLARQMIEAQDARRRADVQLFGNLCSTSAPPITSSP